MPGDVRGSAIRCLGFTETAFKTPGANGNVLYFTQNTVVPSRERVQDMTLSGRRGQSRSVDGNKDVTGTITANIAPQNVGWYLKHLVGVPTTTGAGPYTHVFQPAASGANALPPGFTLETDFTAAMSGAARYLRQNGLRASDGTITISPTGFVTLAINVMGATWEQNAASLDATPTDNGNVAFSAAGVSVVVGGGAPLNLCQSGLTLNWSNDLDGDKRCIGAGGERDGMPEGFVITGGSMSMFLDHEDVINTVLSGLDTELDITLSVGDGLGTAGNESLTIHLGDIVFAVTAPTVEGPRGLRVSANFTAHRMGTAEIDATWTLLNAVATID